MKDFTLVTACTPKYIKRLRWGLPSWKIKPQFKDRKMILFHHGFKSLRNLKFVKSYFDVKFIYWDMPEYENIRELMLSSFILGAAKYVDTEYFVKIDCDAYFTNSVDVFTEKDFNYDVVGHKWNYTKPGHWINDLDNYYLNEDTGRYGHRYYHRRLASFGCLHKTEFIQMLAKKFGDRLPVPSHDTVAWYFADKMPDRSWGTKSIKRLGFRNSSKWKKIREDVCSSGDINNRLLRDHLLDHIQLEVTSFCQLGCFNCDRNCGIYKDKSYISLDELKKFVDDSIKMRKKWKRIDIIGGEPTYYPHFKEMFEVIKVYKDFYPRCLIRFSTNGLGKFVQEKLKEIPSWVYVRNSNKKSQKQSFVAYNSAPVDNGEKEVKACSVPWRCGMALTPNGYFVCNPGGSLAKIFQMDIGIKELKDATPEKLMKQIPVLCKYCGNSNCRSRHLTTKPEISKSWQIALEKLKNGNKK